jgi:Tfp pilus assembly protein PilE
MAVLIGVLAPAYLQYVEKSKKTADCTTIGSIMDAIEVVAADPAITWASGASAKISVTVNAAGGSVSTISGGPASHVEKIVDMKGAAMTSGWGTFTFEATKDTNGFVEFKITSSQTKTEIGNVSKALANRFE